MKKRGVGIGGCCAVMYVVGYKDVGFTNHQPVRTCCVELPTHVSLTHTKVAYNHVHVVE